VSWGISGLLSHGRRMDNEVRGEAVQQLMRRPASGPSVHRHSLLLITDIKQHLKHLKSEVLFLSARFDPLALSLSRSGESIASYDWANSGANIGALIVSVSALDSKSVRKGLPAIWHGLYMS
jgi:hypothetical protein